MPPKAKQAPKVKVGGKILAAFQKLDENGDGTITKQELTRVLQHLDKAMWTERHITSIMRAIDRDGNGKIDYDEFVRWIMAGPQSDKNRNSVASLGEGAAEEAPSEDVAKKGQEEGKAGGAGGTGDQKEVDGLLDSIFTLYDEDGDEQIERLELLDGEEKRLGKLDFGPKQRKEIINWFKEAGAEGTPTSGMYLSKEKWMAAMLKTAAQELGAEASAPGKVAAWLKEHRLAPLEAAMPKKAAAAASSGVDGAAPAASAAPAAPPTYPLTTTLKELADKIKEAASFQKNVLVLSSGLDQVETYMTYQMNSLVDCKMIINETLVKKSKSKDEARAEVRKTLSQAMNSSGFCKPLHIRLNNSAFDWKSFCCEEVPAEMFDPDVWTIESAFKQGFFDEGYKFNLGVEDNKKWKEFYVVVTSTFDLEKATEFLADKIPAYDKLAIIVVDPSSVAS